MTASGSDRKHSTEPQSVAVRPGLVLYLKGLAMGLGDSVPGVSGGTIAVITNIYDTLIYSLGAFDSSAARMLFGGRPRDFWAHINGAFLGLLGLGVLSGLLLSASTVLYLLENYFEPLMAFFIGLVLASSWLLKDSFDMLRWRNLLALLLGIALATAVSFINPLQSELSYSYVFFSGAVAICAMILPGLSGAFILLLLGVYQFILNALIGFDLGYILVFAGGCAIGLLAFSRVIAWMLHHYHQLSYGFITGMLLGSLLVLWPWQQAQRFYADSDGELHALRTVNLTPMSYAELTGNEPLVFTSLLTLIIGLLLVLLLHRLSNTTSSNLTIQES